jgi:putative DNA primase/helicase
LVDAAEIQRIKSTVDLVQLFVADGSDVVRDGSRYKTCCPFHDDRSPSCYIFDDGHFKCFGCEAYGDAIEYLTRRRGVTFQAAIEMIGASPITTTPRKIDNRRKYTCVMPIPANAPKCNFEINGEGLSSPTAIYWYLSRTGEKLLAVVRYNYTAKSGEVSKTIRPWSWARRDSDGSCGWQMTRPDNLLPIYGLNRLADKADLPVLIVEGEKSADAAHNYLPFHACITWCGGSKSVDKVDWSPLAGRDVILWPDYDHAGAKAMLAVADHARKNGAKSVAVVDLRGLQAKEKGWDVADGTQDDAEIVIGLAKPNTDEILAHLITSLPGQPISAEKPLADEKTGAGGGDDFDDNLDMADLNDDDDLEANDIFAASRFVSDNKGKVLYCPTWERWHVWDGKRWRADEQGMVRQLAEQTALRIARDYAAEGMAANTQANANARRAKTLREMEFITAEQRAEADKLENSIDGLRKKARHAKAKAEQVQLLKRIKDMIELASSRAEIIVQVEELDADEQLFNCLNGVVNLRTGDIYAHDSKRRITRLAPVDYDPETAPGDLMKVLTHLLQVAFTQFDVDNKTCTPEQIGKLNKSATKEMIEFAQNILGNSLQGNNRLERFYVWQGPGGSGKGSLMEAIKAAIGDYAMTAEFQSFIKVQGNRVRDDLARLAEARFVLASEAEQGEQMAAGVIKAITGRDTISARQLYGTYFEFRPRLTLHLQCNDLPRADDQDSGLWRRLVLIPCGPQIPEDKRDPAIKDWLFDKNKGGKAVLAWLITGAIRTHAMKVIPEPVAVKSASLAYRREQDPTKEFFAEALRFSGPQNHDQTMSGVTDVLKAYGKWCDANQLAPRIRCSPRTIAHRLENLGCYKKKVRVGASTAWAWLGVCVNDQSEGSELIVPTNHRPTDEEHETACGFVPVFQSSASLEKSHMRAHTHAHAHTLDDLSNLVEHRNIGTKEQNNNSGNQTAIDLENL